MRRRSLRLIDLPTEEFSENVLGPSITFRPALPKRPAGGMANAAGLKNSPQQSTAKPVASARPLPTDPVPPVSDWLPSTRAVRGVPVEKLTVPCQVQSLSQRFKDLEELAVDVKLNVCRRSKLDKPRSACRSLSFCATVFPAPPKVEELSIDFPRV